MLSSNKVEAMLLALVPAWFGGSIVRWIALLALCAAYLQGGFNKLIEFPGAIAEMQHFGLSPPALHAGIVIALELGASAMILAGIYRWIGAFALAGFTLMATFLANRFWEMAPPERIMAANGTADDPPIAAGLVQRRERRMCAI